MHFPLKLKTFHTFTKLWQSKKGLENFKTSIMYKSIDFSCLDQARKPYLTIYCFIGFNHDMLKGHLSNEYSIENKKRCKDPFQLMHNCILVKLYLN
jgi:hypothetical protein